VEKPFVFALSRIEWQLFCSLTFVRENMPASLCRRYWFTFARAVAEIQGVHFRRLLWLLRSEFGEIGGRYHYHALIGGLSHHGLSMGMIFRLKRTWEQALPLVLRKDEFGDYRKLSKFCGMARIRLFDPGMDALDYCTDLESVDGGASGWSLSGANSYEAKKFGKTETVEFSQSVARVMACRRYRDSAVGVQHGQSGAGLSNDLCRSIMPLSPAPWSSSPAITGDTAVNLASVVPLHTECKSAWRDTGRGMFELAGSVGL
jgi:hypothetical protein